MITLTTATYLHEADMIRMRLEASGITAFIPDQNTSSIQPLFSNAIGGIRIQVDESDLARAREILKNDLPQADRGMFECPVCKSDAVAYESVSKRFAFLSLFLLGLPLLLRKRECRCNSCGHQWKET